MNIVFTIARVKKKRLFFLLNLIKIINFMKKTYKVITDFGTGDLFIDCFASLETASAEMKKSIMDEAMYVYLLETQIDYLSDKGSYEKVISFFKK